ncbi:TfoX/Sxy family protein [Ponticoccus sp. SC2-23]|uniref:TfoX/Sxy family protein n=1 Tax=Alexandriicola marinus TaxID=2081710 RepID=UPI000FD73268|nr:TfoX/Sxy family protein [Alexandriicola marinus]MBM1219333.1 TfoX/Sxy family protein [Ponticoccus sp. SC6-9]MBM1223595.1 TfoX/Sxy family protein [Ponticoccus sp. SC6-15]MBM1229146.1 TfoX/Sxy family protein [Ponticoccus sp. SC6-38]MBM1232561.1 TfoX/Sxy family protein [Ponticoccus sp. SC6-45]MBM1237489.1 TfoX/Sxy family protein [Ponticoccus sp. SC6-49]MBM1241572.1 TfoX/Sxy family protein [Ponticoccus sp. SC2-64]MBM1246085.1 TfoX/Sxy family protein [Ponticoccus sp. SC6-42]MBM1250563.1 TfoX/
MSVTDADIAYATELFSGVGPLTTRKMMGGLSIYCEGQIFAILSSEARIYLKATGDFAEALAAEGAEIFEMGGRSMGYWTLPDAALDDPDLATDWARRALAAL